MHITTTEALLWALGTFLKLCLSVLAFRRGLHRRMPIMTGFFLLGLVTNTAYWWVYRTWGYASWTAWYSAWAIQGIAFLARALAVGEICWKSLREYRGIWGITWRLLCATTLLLVLHAAVDARGDAHWVVPFVLTAERDLEMAMAVILLMLLSICAYYRVPLTPPLRMFAFGFCFNSTIQALNNSLMRGWLAQHLFLWNPIRSSSFDVALIMCCVALWKPLPAERPAPELLAQQTYDDLVPEVNLRLRLLNDRLLQILRS